MCVQHQGAGRHPTTLGNSTAPSLLQKDLFTLIMANRKNLKNPNGLFLGTPGSGKSFSAKREIVNVFLLTEDDIIIADPENEYGPLVEQFGEQGQVIDISPTSTNYINPMDINLDYSDDENPITLKSDFILSLCDLIIGGKEGLSPIEHCCLLCPIQPLPFLARSKEPPSTLCLPEGVPLGP